MPSGQALRALTAHASIVMCLAFSSDSRFLASGSADNTIMVWDLLEDRDCTTYVQTRFYLLLFSFVLYIYMYILHWSIYTFHSFEARGRSWRAQCWCALHSAICVGRCILSVSVPTLESARKVFHACWLTSSRACVCVCNTNMTTYNITAPQWVNWKA